MVEVYRDLQQGQAAAGDSLVLSVLASGRRRDRRRGRAAPCDLDRVAEARDAAAAAVEADGEEAQRQGALRDWRTLGHYEERGAEAFLAGLATHVRMRVAVLERDGDALAGCRLNGAPVSLAEALREVRAGRTWPWSVMARRAALRRCWASASACVTSCAAASCAAASCTTGRRANPRAGAARLCWAYAGACAAGRRAQPPWPPHCLSVGRVGMGRRQGARARAERQQRLWRRVGGLRGRLGRAAGSRTRPARRRRTRRVGPPRRRAGRTGIEAYAAGRYLVGGAWRRASELVRHGGAEPPPRAPPRGRGGGTRALWRGPLQLHALHARRRPRGALLSPFRRGAAARVTGHRPRTSFRGCSVACRRSGRSVDAFISLAEFGAGTLRRVPEMGSKKGFSFPVFARGWRDGNARWPAGRNHKQPHTPLFAPLLGHACSDYCNTRSSNDKRMRSPAHKDTSSCWSYRPRHCPSRKSGVHLREGKENAPSCLLNHVISLLISPSSQCMVKPMVSNPHPLWLLC